MKLCRFFSRLRALAALIAGFVLADAGQLRDRRLRHVSSKPSGSNALVQKESHHLASSPEGFKKPWGIDHARCVTGYWRVGCFDDVQKEQRRVYKEMVPKEDQEPMSVELCWDFCKNISGASYFGLERGDNCYCTPAFDSFNSGNDDSTACTVPCVGNYGQMCGGEKLADIYEMHDCNNLPAVPCKHPPKPIKHAKEFESTYYMGKMSPCKNAATGALDTKGNSKCEIECEPGYYIHENTLACEERGNRLVYTWSQLVGSAACAPVNCGKPANLAHATYPMIDIRFPNKAEYQCDVGYALNMSAHGPRDQAVQCLPTGAFEQVKPCHKVECGACPTGPKYEHAVPAEQGMRAFLGECTYFCEQGYTLNSDPNGPRQFEISCQYTGEFEEPRTCLPVKCGAAPAIDFAAVQESWNKQSIAHYPDMLPYECDFGYSLTGIYGEPTEFNVNCTSTGDFTVMDQRCSPVSNGNPPNVKNAIYLDRIYVYGESVTYTCKTGYTMDGKVGGLAQKTIFAGGEGQWKERAPECLPIECGAPKAVEFSTIAGTPPQIMNFDSPALSYTCNPGYSTSVGDNIFAPSSASWHSVCQANGEMIVKTCVNINDCAQRNCGHGTCEDRQTATAVPLENYQCNCDAGAEEIVRASEVNRGHDEKYCRLINDCPVEDPCGGETWRNASHGRGQCTDGHIGYSCICSIGYELGTIDALPANETCKPLGRELTFPVPHSTYSPDHKNKRVTYDDKPWDITCDNGYSLTGAANGAKTYKQEVTTTGAVNRNDTCLPVSCGAPKLVGFADMVPKLGVMVYDDTITYTCDTGYTVGGDAASGKAYMVSCLADGSISDPYVSGDPPAPRSTAGMSCQPVKCGALPAQANALYDTNLEFHYGQAAIVNCNTGYSIDGSSKSEKFSYTVPCEATGSFQKGHPTCQLIICGEPQAIDHTSHDPTGSLTYGDKVTYTVDSGHVVEIDGEVINTTFECHCDDTGLFNESCAHQANPRPINCGPAPVVVHASVTGSTEFGGTLTATAFVGFTLDGLATGGTSFTFWCMANGEFSAVQTFRPIECGLCPDVADISDVTLDPAEHSSGELPLELVGIKRGGLRVRSLSNASHLKRGKKVKGKRLFEAVYQDQVTYECAEGHVAVHGSVLDRPPIGQVDPQEPREFTVECGATGDYFSPSGMDGTLCVPVTCDFTHATRAVQYPVGVPPGETGRIQYTQTQLYKCIDGHTINGAIGGATEVSKQCLATGQLEESRDACMDTDFCADNTCGVGGTCQDGHTNYTCECAAGYRLEDNGDRPGHSKCVDVDECAEMGNAKCGGPKSGFGTCTDAIDSYTCACETGYELSHASTFEACYPITCPVLPTRDGTSEDGITSTPTVALSFRETYTYYCHSGHTVGSAKDGAASFTVECGADGQYTGLSACAPIQCGQSPSIDASVGSRTGAATAKFGDPPVGYQCAAGHSTTGAAVGPNRLATFSVVCTASGDFSAMETCEPIRCPSAPTVMGATSAATTLVHAGDTIKYTCAEGHKTEEGASEFTVTCENSGEYSGPQSCTPISCGVLPGVANGAPLFAELSYPETLSVTCDPGHTEDGDPDGESTFIVSCGADGKYVGLKECKPVQCPAPPAKPGTTTRDGDKVYGELFTWQCLQGFSVDGSKSGDVSFSKPCGTTGAFDGLEPNGCEDIDGCEGDPCGGNGVCTDIIGQLSPGYSCVCDEGFEIKSTPTGPTCGADDCTGDPCGTYGTCTDLSKDGQEGMYSCACPSGFEVVIESSSAQSCVRRSCGTLPHVTRSCMDGLEICEKPYAVTSFYSLPEEIDAFTGRPIVYALDTANFRCIEGYSTDGRTPEARDLSVGCTAFGEFDTTVEENMCQPLLCADTFLPTIENGFVTNRDDDGFHFGDSARIKCKEGYTTTGQPSASTEFEVACLSSGTFSAARSQCKPIKCYPYARPIPNALSSLGILSKPGAQTTWTCSRGHFAARPGETSPDMSISSFPGTCMPDSSVSTEFDRCLPAVCSTIPAQPGTVQFEDETLLPASNLVYLGERAEFNCKQGYAVGGRTGGFLSYEILCESDGTLSGTVFQNGVVVDGGTQTGESCELIENDVSIVPADGGMEGVSGADIVVAQGSATLGSATTDIQGFVTFKLGAGTYTVSASKVYTPPSRCADYGIVCPGLLTWGGGSGTCAVQASTGGSNCKAYCASRGSICVKALGSSTPCEPAAASHAQQTMEENGCLQDGPSQICVCKASQYTLQGSMSLTVNGPIYPYMGESVVMTYQPPSVDRP